LRKWFQLFRAQTGFATVYTIITPYLLAGGDQRNLTFLIPLSLLTHYASFGHNSVMDYWHDVKDVHKKHHPLVSGAISIRSAHQAIHTLLVAVGALWVITSLYMSPAPHLAISFLLLYSLLGHAYNDGLDKHTIHSWAPISLCYTALAAFGWFLASPNPSIVLYLLLSVSFSSIFYQIAFEGNLKDICIEENMLTAIAKEVKCINYPNGETLIIYNGPKWMFATLRVFIDTAILATIAGFTNSNISLATMLLLTFIQTSTIVMLNLGLDEGIKRNTMLEYFGLIETIQFFRVFATIAINFPSLMLYILLVVIGASYFYLMNRWLWGSKWGPRV
jgi:hypothetical protein